MVLQYSIEFSIIKEEKYDRNKAKNVTTIKRYSV